MDVANDTLLAIHHLSHRYPTAKGFWRSDSHPEAIQDLSFQVGKGEIFGIVGRSGSGKSTLAKIIGGVILDYDGMVKLKGQDIRMSLMNDRKSHYKQVQYLLQDAGSALPPRMKMQRVLVLALQAFQPGLRGKALQDRIHHYMDDVGLDVALLSRFRHQLSGGERQRIYIARALCAMPDLLVLDESLTALDKSVQEEMIKLLKDLNRQQGLSIILVSHDLRMIRHCCDRILVLKQGQIDSCGPTQKLLTEQSTPYLRQMIDAM